MVAFAESSWGLASALEARQFGAQIGGDPGDAVNAVRERVHMHSSLSEVAGLAPTRPDLGKPVGEVGDLDAVQAVQA